MRFRSRLLLLALAACGGPAPPQPPPGLASLAEHLLAAPGSELHPWPATAPEADALCARLQVVLAAAGPDALTLPEVVTARLRKHVEQGGRLVLLGRAAALAHRLGFERNPPDRDERLRWGYDDRTLLGQLELGVRGTPQGAASAPELARPALVAGGVAPVVPLVAWSRRMPEQGTVLGWLVERRDGTDAELPDAVLVSWRQAAGTVVALGLLPEPANSSPELAQDAARLLRSILGTHASAVAIAAEPPRAVAAALPPLPQRELPGRHQAPWWGFLVSANRGRAARTPIPPDQAAREAIALPARAGASWSSFHVQDAELGLPLVWPATDPITRPHGYRGHAQWPQWTAATLAQLAAAAHARGLMALLQLDPAPVHGGQPVEQLAALKWLGRTSLELRLLGEGAFDGLLLPSGLPALEFVPALLAPYQPQALWLHVGGNAGLTGVLDMATGRPRGLPLGGRSDRWRDTAADDGLRVALLDVDVHRSGTYADWLVTQVQDFVRRREGRAGLLWRGLSPDQMPPELLPYVVAMSLAPLDAALAMRLTATGRDGWRDLIARRLPQPPVGLGAESPLPASTAVLQNNHFRLSGSGGPLRFDPTGRALLREDDGAAILVAARFVQTRIRGVRPRPEMAEIATIDFVAGRPRGAGGFGAVASVRGEERGAGRTPARLQRDAVPDWPRRVEFEFTAPSGAYELELGLRGREGAGIVELSCGGELLQLVPFQLGGDRVLLPCELAQAGTQQLALDLVEGGAVALDVCRLTRRGDLGRAARIAEPGGHRAVLEERTGSSAYRELARWTTHADLPGMLWEVEVLGCDRGLQVQRELALDGYDTLLRAHEAGAALRSPFVLRSSDPRLPPLAVVPLALPANQALQFTPGLLTLAGAPESKQRITIGFLWLRDIAVADWEALLPWWREIATPPVLEIGFDGRAQFAARLPIAAVRVVRLHSAALDAWLVREGDYWLVRGGQPARGGGDWLRFYTPADADAEVLTGAARRESVHAGPGAQHVLALRERQPQSVRVRMLAEDPLLPPSLLFTTPFDSVKIDGERWDWFDGAQVWLPAGRPEMRVEVARGGAPRPRLLRTDADVRSCRYDEAGNLLELFVRPRAGRPGNAWHVAWIAGPEPLSVDGGEVVPPGELRHPPELAAALGKRGFLLRMAPGLVRMRFPP